MSTYERVAIYDESRRHGRALAVARWASRCDEISSDDVMEAHSVTRQNANQILSRLVRAGRLVRVGCGLYRVPA